MSAEEHPREYPEGEACRNGYTVGGAWLEDIVSLLMLAGDEAVRRAPARRDGGYRGAMHPFLLAMPRVKNPPPTSDLADLTAGLADRRPGPHGHDALDRYQAMLKIVKAAGLNPERWGLCPTCKGTGIHPDDIASET